MHFRRYSKNVTTTTAKTAAKNWGYFALIYLTISSLLPIKRFRNAGCDGFVLWLPLRNISWDVYRDAVYQTSHAVSKALTSFSSVLDFYQRLITMRSMREESCFLWYRLYDLECVVYDLFMKPLWHIVLKPSPESLPILPKLQHWCSTFSLHFKRFKRNLLF